MVPKLTHIYSNQISVRVHAPSYRSPHSRKFLSPQLPYSVPSVYRYRSLVIKYAFLHLTEHRAVKVLGNVWSILTIASIVFRNNMVGTRCSSSSEALSSISPTVRHAKERKSLHEWVRQLP